MYFMAQGKKFEKSYKWITEKNFLLIFSSFGADKKLVKPDFINEDTIITLDPDTGKALSSFGKGLFLMPHGLTIDNEGNHYVTDVGLHQVMRVCNFPLHYTTHSGLTVALFSFG